MSKFDEFKDQAKDKAEEIKMTMRKRTIKRPSF